ncbi:no significant blast hit [Histoplasma capsulatum var. duboisii H88]|uniref:No significant blast hit n=1 Tax=Ajellomyces capsulatus (strain H88) TaxID=544711 RepID=A0A8A1LPZ8_AJEC8|nr:no significant blast hit [Histoplasma capsulatum var. duboisii H88]
MRQTKNESIRSFLISICQISAFQNQPVSEYVISHSPSQPQLHILLATGISFLHAVTFVELVQNVIIHELYMKVPQFLQFIQATYPASIEENRLFCVS